MTSLEELRKLTSTVRKTYLEYTHIQATLEIEDRLIALESIRHEPNNIIPDEHCVPEVTAAIVEAARLAKIEVLREIRSKCIVWSDPNTAEAKMDEMIRELENA